MISSKHFQISKVRTSPKEPENLIFLNAEEENFLPLCDMYLNMEDEGEPVRSISAFDEVNWSEIIGIKSKIF
jgi:hypothetical protein